MRLFFRLFLVLVLILGSVLIFKVITFVSVFDIPGAQYGLLAKSFDSGTLLFTGDVMLGRSVELTIDEKGIRFPFANLIPLLKSHSLVVANFEASVPQKHVLTPSNTMRFSVREGFLPSLSEYGFDVLSLANNHAFDFGESGFTHTRMACERAKLTCVGNPNAVGTSSVYTTRVGDTMVGIIFIHTLFGMPDATQLLLLTNQLKETTDIQIAYIHWGDEYTMKHNVSQEVLAHTLIDQGIDSVIGHHPHVIQDVELYRGKPIFYSLGNLIFDQYFSDAVQQGYVVSLAINKRHLEYTLIPYETITARSQPTFMEDAQKLKLFLTMLPQSNFTQTEIENGRFRITRD